MAVPGISPRSSRATFAGILLFGLLAMTARPALDPDLWWHLRTGQWIVDNHSVPHADPFSFTRTGQAWVSHEWLSEVLFYEVWRHAGFGGLIVFSAVITTAGFMLLYFRCGGVPYLAAAATVLGALASAPAWGVRPQMFTFALASLLLWLLERSERTWVLVAIPPMFLLWLNLHAGFALGPTLMLACALGLLIEVALGDTAWREVRGSILRVLALVLVCALLVPLNPSGTQLYRYPLDTLRSSAMRTVIVEWFSADFHKPRFAPYIGLWLLLLVVLALGKHHPKARVLVPLILTGALSLDAVRHISIFVLVAVPVIATGLSSMIRATVIVSSRQKLVRGPALAVVALTLLAGFALTRWAVLIRGQSSAEAEHFPSKAVARLRAGDFGDQVFAYYDWGGYAIFKLYPRYRVFVDGRADLYGGELLRDFQTAVQLRAGWQQVLDRWRMRVVLVPPQSALAQALMLDPEWHAEYQDSQAVLLVRHKLVGSETVKSGFSVTKPSPSSRKNAKMVGVARIVGIGV
jgi:hypothetical protein